ncbi:MAG TPA: hypothetical protein VMX95_04765 [Thermodesulfobacteriota bacterium]|nr:hypothetical protein [Thermodesulfobacteriota bacterium]
MDQEKAILKIIKEYQRATELNGPFHSSHEGYAVILEEVEELWQEIKKKAADRRFKALEQEAVQIGAMAFRFLVDLIPPCESCYCLNECGYYGHCPHVDKEKYNCSGEKELTCLGYKTCPMEKDETLPTKRS